MQQTPARTIWDVITDFLANTPTPQEIVNYRLPDDLQARAHDLLERNGEGQLTPEEAHELLEFARADDVISLLKAKTMLKLREHTP